ncbi:unnamed protein product [Diabrotica balteata]|uniref:Uncharacterized protein n=1 Tax=Diabrotica balteata TaxID=107213 RepID=A0A9N9XA47_DIABA|nr:unnamed protein product [Diabrotica balteata]
MTETDLEEMLNSQPKEETSIITGNVTFNLKNLSDGLRKENELCDFIMKIDSSMGQGRTFKTQIANSTAKYQFELKEFLKSAKQEKITTFFKPLTKPKDNIMDTTDQPNSICHVQSIHMYPLQPSNTKDVPFNLLAGETVLHVGHSVDGVVVVTTYRLYLQSRSKPFHIPVSLIEVVEIRELFNLHIGCKDARTYR